MRTSLSSLRVDALSTQSGRSGPGLFKRAWEVVVERKKTAQEKVSTRKAGDYGDIDTG